jgi:hypothetical protein
MKKLLLTLFMVCAILPAASAAAYAKPPTTVSGELDYWLDDTISMREANGNSFLYATEHEEWRGDFVGVGHSEFRVGMFASGFWNVWLRCEFSGTVHGKEGTLEIQMVGKKPLDGDWYGQWVIRAGTGDLANVHGRGTWSGPGYRSDEKVPGDPDCYYSGQIHFDPN